nr:MAG TPA: hypothetical protein [Caudoviricetes sp.]
MANVGFLRGSQANLNTLMTSKTGIKEGSFYLTNDTNRLYFGKSATELVALNEGVITVAAIADLPSGADLSNEIGHFYYATAENILCVYNGSQWVQINPDTDTQVSSVNTAVVVAENAATATTTLKFSRDGKDLDAAENKSATLKFVGADLVLTANGADGIKLTGDTYSIGSSAIAGGVAIDLNRDNAADTTRKGKIGSVNLKAGNAIKLVRDTNGDITVNATTEVGSVESTTFTVSQTGQVATIESAVKDSLSTDPVKDSFKLAADGNDISLSTDTETKTVKIKGSHFSLSGETKETDNTAKITLKSDLTGSASSDFSIAGGDNVTVTQNGSAISITAIDTTLDSVAVDAQAAGYKVTVKDTTTTDGVTTTFDPKIQLAGGESVSFVNGIATIPTKVIDDKITAAKQSMDAMVFKGVATAVPTGTQEIGWTYKATGDFTIPAGSVEGSAAAANVKTGDLIVATGIEVGGVITSNLKWYVVPSGDEENTTYSFARVEDGGKVGIKLAPDGMAANVVGQMTVEAGDNIAIAANNADEDGKYQNVKISHGAVGTAVAVPTATKVSQKVDEALVITAHEVAYDKYGHITGVTAKEYTLKDTDTHNDIDTFAVAASENGQGVVHSVKTKDNTNAMTAQVNYVAATDNQNISIKTTSAAGVATVTFDLVWGTF